MMFGEAIVFFRSELATDFKYIRKQGMQLHSKMRFISAQFETFLSNDYWKRNGSHSNNMAKFLAAELSRIPQVEITQPVDANGVFVKIPEKIIPRLQEEQFFYVWAERISEARLMCSFDSRKEDIENFVGKLRELLDEL